MLAPVQQTEETRPRDATRSARTLPTSEACGTYLTEIGEFGVLSRSEEQRLAQDLQLAKKQLRRRLLACQCSIDSVVTLLKGIQEGRQRLDRFVDVPVTNMAEKERVRTRLAPTLLLLNRITTSNQRYMRIAIADSVPPRERRSAWRQIVKGRYRAAALVESLNLKTGTLRALLPNIRDVAAEMKYLQEELGLARSKSGDRSRIDGLRHQLLKLMLSQLDSPRTIHRRIGMIEAEELEFDRLRKQFACCNLRFVISTIKRYRNTGLAISDLIQEGNIGLLRAIEKFDPDVGCRFTTYADRWIRQEVIQAISRTKSALKIPLSVSRTKRRISEAREEIAQEFGREPSMEEVADSIGVHSEKLGVVTRMSNTTISLDQQLCIDGRSQLVDVVQATDDTQQLDEEHCEELKLRLAQAMELLHPRERQVLNQRFGLEDGSVKTLLEIGQSLGVSKERARQLVQRAIGKLRQPVCATLLEDLFVESRRSPARRFRSCTIENATRRR